MMVGEHYSEQDAYEQRNLGEPILELENLSGGNQQKVILARWLNTQSDILLLDNPTQGIDVDSKAEIYHLIQELAQSGKPSWSTRWRFQRFNR